MPDALNANDWLTSGCFEATREGRLQLTAYGTRVLVPRLQLHHLSLPAVATLYEVERVLEALAQAEYEAGALRIDQLLCGTDLSFLERDVFEALSDHHQSKAQGVIPESHPKQRRGTAEVIDMQAWRARRDQKRPTP